MKNKFSQFAYFVSKLDSRYVRLAYFVLALGFSILMKSPAGGGTDPI